MIEILPPKNLKINGSINIPSSKSISNRALIIQALSENNIILDNLSISDDTQILKNALIKISETQNNSVINIDIGMAGTSFRFLTAFLSIQKGEFILTGSKRIKERPIKPLVDALQEIGADIKYVENYGFAPIRIKGNLNFIVGKEIELKSDISSQFITALMLIAPMIKNGLTIKLIGKIASKTYISMTKNIMEFFGTKIFFEKDIIKINQQNYQEKKMFIESDWSSASYFYECLALAKKGDLKLMNFSKNSIQGDSELVNIFKKFGITTTFNKNNIHLTKTNEVNKNLLKYDFINHSDLAQTVISTCVALDIEGEFIGLESLKIKETNRVEAIRTEIQKVNWILEEKDKTYYLYKDNQKNIEAISFRTYNDHRMAMCLAPLSIIYGNLKIKNQEVVSKSNPLYWKQLTKIGFIIKLEPRKG